MVCGLGGAGALDEGDGQDEGDALGEGETEATAVAETSNQEAQEVCCASASAHDADGCAYQCS